jgi:hypothetical protein
MTLALYGKSKRRQGTLVALALLAVLAAIAGGLLGGHAFDRVFADHPESVQGVTPTPFSGNVTTCPAEFDFSTSTQNAPADGSMWSIGGGTVTVDLSDGGTHMSFVSTIPLMRIYLKAGSGGNYYDYQPGGVTADGDLWGDLNPQGVTQGISHVVFCANSDPAEVTIDKSDSGDGSYAHGESFDFILDVTITGDDTTGATTMSDTIPGEFSIDLDGVTGPTGWDCDNAGQVVTCEIPEGTAPDEYQVTISVTVVEDAACGPVTNTATIDGDDVGDPSEADEQVTIECGGLVVEKILLGDQDSPTFTGDVTGPHSFDESWSLMGGQSTGDEFLNIPVGQYTVTEDAPEAGFDHLGFIEISGDAQCASEPTEFPDDGVVDVSDGSSVTVCVYNEPTPEDAGTIWNVKIVVNVEDDTTTFTADVTGPENYTASFSETTPDSESAPAGGYTSTENEPLPAGYEHIVTIVGTFDGVPICPEEPFQQEEILDISFLLQGSEGTLEAGGELVFCHYNEAVGTVQVQKIDTVPGDQTWNFEVHRTGPNGLNTVGVSEQIVNSGTSEPATVLFGEYEAEEIEAGFASFDECPEEPGPGDYVTTHTPPTDITIDKPGENILFVFTNEPCPTAEATGTLIIEKWHDVDGDGQRDAGEPALEGWTMTVTGPEFPGGASFDTNASGQVILPGIFAGIYTVSEALESGWFNTGRIVDGVVLAPSTSAIAVVADGAEQEELVTTVEFGNRQLGSIRVVKIVVDQVGSVTSAGWQFLLTGGCDGVAIGGTTGATGQVTFPNLKPTDNCAPYLVTELAANTNGFSTSPSAAQGATVSSAQETTVTFTNSRGTTPQPTPPVNPTPTNTVPPTATPTATPVETVAGDITPGPGSEATPIAPETGSGASAGAAGMSIALLLMGLAAVTMGAGVLAIARKR